jgi:peptide/nickel transport system substrate-binding protein
MKPRSLPSLAATSPVKSLALFSAVAIAIASLAAKPARHPRYGATLHVEIGASVTSIDPAAAAATPDESAAKREIESLIYEKRNVDGSVVGVAGSGPFRISEWEPGKHLALAANDDFSGGRPFVDAIEIDMGRSERDRLVDLEVGRADLSEIPAEDARQAASRGVRITTSQPDDLLALVFLPGHAATEDARLREAISASIDRASIVDFILQKEGEPAGGLLPEWSSGTAFLFPTAADPAHAKELRSQIGASPEIRLGYDSGDAQEESIAERIVVNARESGISLTADAVAFGAATPKVDAQIKRFPMSSPRPAIALADTLAQLAAMGVVSASTPLSESASPEQVYTAEHAALESYRAVPLVWLPRVYGLSDRVKDWQAPATGEAWPLADVWLDIPPASK